MKEIYNKLITLAQTQSDVREHLFTLLGYSIGYDHITEMGVRDVVSTWSFLAAKPKKLVCIDIYESYNLDEAKQYALHNDIELEFLLQDTIDPSFQIENTDVLFIDTFHTYPQLKTELFQHSNNVNKYIILHDTTTFGLKNESNYPSYPRGLRAAVSEFLQYDTNWSLVNVYENCNGLAILERITQ